MVYWKAPASCKPCCSKVSWALRGVGWHQGGVRIINNKNYEVRRSIAGILMNSRWKLEEEWACLCVVEASLVKKTVKRGCGLTCIPPPQAAVFSHCALKTDGWLLVLISCSLPFWFPQKNCQYSNNASPYLVSLALLLRIISVNNCWHFDRGSCKRQELLAFWQRLMQVSWTAGNMTEAHASVKNC